MARAAAAAALLALALSGLAAAIPSAPLNFTQRVDHFSENVATFDQRYYMNASSFGGPGFPIICILGGEGAIPPTTGIYYPSVVALAARLKALVIEPEHRFFGTSNPTAPYDTQRLQLLNVQQALADAAAFITAMRHQFGCSGTNGEPRCPVVTVGGSYPGWLSFAMRLRYPAVVDIAYAGSAPVRFYSEEVGQYDYYRVVTASAARANASCPDAVRAMLGATIGAPGVTKAEIVAGLNMCAPLPQYMQDGDTQLLVDEVSMVASYTFANLNMGNYPPTQATGLARACAAIVAGAASAPWPTLATFLSTYTSAFGGAARSRRGGAPFVPEPEPEAEAASVSRGAACYDISTQIPSGVNGTISCGDWSGCGTGGDGASWDFETCTHLVQQIGMSGVTDMMLPREWTFDWMNAHCASRFGGLVPRPYELAELWGLATERLPAVTSRVIFTNGLNDGWSAGGILVNLSSTLLAFNAPNGAHHSDLSHLWPDDVQNTPDVTAMQQSVAATIEAWLAEL